MLRTCARNHADHIGGAVTVASTNELMAAVDQVESTSENLGFTGPDGFWYPYYARGAGDGDIRAEEFEGGRGMELPTEVS